jgi:2-polyprenyl-3-methyl-5-hydroxy-6-metoxy-1,4-benzoquinol methylase
METVSACNLCGASARDFLFLAEDHYSSEKFSLMRCRQCGCVYTDPRPAPEELSRFYPPAYYGGSDGQRFRGGLEKVVHLFRRRLADRVSCQFPGGGRVLEVGSGRGTLLAELAKRGWQAVGTEYSTALAEASLNNLGVTVFPTPDLRQCQFESGSFNAVICYHVVEHLTAPLETLTEIRRIIHPDGLLIVAVPNFGGLIARLTQRHWFALDVPRHLHHFTPASLTTALHQARFEISQRSTLSLEQDVFGFAQSCLNMAGLPFNILYDLIRSQQARLRHSSSPKSIAEFFRDWSILGMGGALSILGLPTTVLAAWAGQGGTLEYWAKPIT